jgi:hypothetical protein
LSDNVFTWGTDIQNYTYTQDATWDIDKAINLLRSIGSEQKKKKEEAEAKTFIPENWS